MWKQPLKCNNYQSNVKQPQNTMHYGTTQYIRRWRRGATTTRLGGSSVLGSLRRARRPVQPGRSADLRLPTRCEWARGGRREPVPSKEIEMRASFGALLYITSLCLASAPRSSGARRSLCRFDHHPRRGPYELAAPAGASAFASEPLAAGLELRATSRLQRLG